MWNVNIIIPVGFDLIHSSFILTMWNVNVRASNAVNASVLGFILTMWNVNQANKFFENKI
ncbi:MAG: hypothetical protein ACRDCB_10070 [Clostridium sp.]